MFEPQPRVSLPEAARQEAVAVLAALIVVVNGKRRSGQERQASSLNRLLNWFQGKFVSSKSAAMNRCSQDTANRDIRDLIDRGILDRGPAGGRNTSYELVVIPA